MRFSKATSGMSVCYRGTAERVLTSRLQPGGIPSGERGRGVTIRIPNQNASQNVRRACCKFESCKLRSSVTHILRGTGDQAKEELLVAK